MQKIFIRKDFKPSSAASSKKTAMCVKIYFDVVMPMKHFFDQMENPLQKKWSFPLRVSKCDQIRSFLRKHLLRKSLKENFILCAVIPEFACHQISWNWNKVRRGHSTFALRNGEPWNANFRIYIFRIWYLVHKLINAYQIFSYFYQNTCLAWSVCPKKLFRLFIWSVIRPDCWIPLTHAFTGLNIWTCVIKISTPMFVTE